FVFTDNSDTDDTKRDTIADLVTAMSGEGLAAAAGVMQLALAELPAVAVDVAADSFALIDDSDSDADKKESIADLVTAMAGAGLTATAGVLSVDSSATAIVEADISMDNFSADTDGLETEFVLTDIPLTASLQVFINGVYAEEGSTKDYELNASSGQTKTITINGDVLATGEKLIVHYIKDN
ncbi:unnamed protein product, partial [marine sediment metagenome]